MTSMDQRDTLTAGETARLSIVDMVLKSPLGSEDIMGIAKCLLLLEKFVANGDFK